MASSITGLFQFIARRAHHNVIVLARVTAFSQLAYNIDLDYVLGQKDIQHCIHTVFLGIGTVSLKFLAHVFKNTAHNRVLSRHRIITRYSHNSCNCSPALDTDNLKHDPRARQQQADPYGVLNISVLALRVFFFSKDNFEILTVYVFVHAVLLRDSGQSVLC